jgi:metal-responsive CopG/Arc/MetJ family transcriptional regulator
MKTTVDLPENLLAEVRATAERRGWNVRVVFEESLRAFLQQEELRERKPSFRLAHTVVGGDKFPDLTFSEMLQATMPDRFSE